MLRLKDFCLFSRYYEAVIDEVTTDGQVSVTFANYSNLGVTTLGLLKLPAAPGSEAAGGSNVGTSLASKKEQLLKQKEYLKKRKQKKQDRFKKMEQVILGSGEKHRMYVGFRYVIRVFFMFFFKSFLVR